MMSAQTAPTLRTASGFGLRFLIVVLFCANLIACEKPQQQQNREQGLPQVTTARPLGKKIIEWDEFTGRFQAIEAVEVRARVSGYLQSIHFEDGEMVSEQDLLFVIDPRPFEAAVEQAQGQYERAQARYDLAKVQLKRVEQLLAKDATSQDDYDEQLAQNRQAEAEVKTAKAALRAARLDLEFTEVRSPIRGRISRRFVTVGNLISGGKADSTLLTTIVSLDPIYLFFDVDERTYLTYMRLAAQGKRPSFRDHRNIVFARLADEEGFPHQGHMNFVDSTLGAETATMRARAVFPNPEEEFAPGMFARIRVPGSARYEALLIPGKAIGRDQARKYVYVLQEGDVIERRLVELGPRACGLRILRKGLKPDERIVIEGLQNARPGEKVDPSAGEFAVRSEDCLADVYDFGDRQYGMTFRDLGDGLN